MSISQPAKDIVWSGQILRKKRFGWRYITNDEGATFYDTKVLLFSFSNPFLRAITEGWRQTL
jgi:hypothetical protein